MAVLKTNADELGLDLIEQFVPFVAEALRVTDAPAVSLGDVQGRVQALFGLNIPQAALRTILGRAASRGLVQRDHGTYVPCPELLAKVDLSAARAKALREHAALQDKLVAYAKATFETTIELDEADRLLLRLVSLRAAPILPAAVRGTDPGVEQGGVSGSQDGAETIVNAFVDHIYRRDPIGFDYLTTIVKGSVLASVLYLPEVGAAEASLDKVSFFFDTSLLLRACGFAGEAVGAPSRELLGLLHEEGARTCCFTHTLREVEGVLDNARAILANPRRHKDARREVACYFLEAGWSSSDVIEAIRGLGAQLMHLGVAVRERPDIDVALGRDELGLEEALRREIGYQRDAALFTDIDSLTAIHRLRNGREARQLERCGSIFVTSNTALVAVARREFQDEYRSGHIPLCISGNDLAALAWLKKPGLAPDLPAKVVVADAYAALRPADDQVWVSYLARIDRMQQTGQVTVTEYQLLRHDLQVRAILLHQTSRADVAFAEGDVEAVLRRARATIADEADQARLHAEAERDEQVAARRQAEEIAGAARRDAVQAEDRRAGEAQAYRRAYEVQVTGYGTRLAKLIARAPVAGAALATTWAGFLSMPAPFGPDLTQWRGWPLHLAGWAVLLVVVLPVLRVTGLEKLVGILRLERVLVGGCCRVVRRILPPLSLLPCERSPEQGCGQSHQEDQDKV